MADRITYTCTGPRKFVKKRNIGRAGCGQDLTALIEAVSDDGADHEVKCPRCGNTSSVRKSVPETQADAV